MVTAIRVSDLVVIPMRASGLDLVASNAAIDLCTDAGVPFFVVINAAKGGSKDKLVEELRSTLFSNDIPIAKTAITQRTAFVTAMSKGKTGAEVRDDEAKKEIEALWQEIKSATLKVVKARGKKGGK
jgi:chromosome partitioning protein